MNDSSPAVVREHRSRLYSMPRLYRAYIMRRLVQFLEWVETYECRPGIRSPTGTPAATPSATTSKMPGTPAARRRLRTSL